MQQAVRLAETTDVFLQTTTVWLSEKIRGLQISVFIPFLHTRKHDAKCMQIQYSEGLFGGYEAASTARHNVLFDKLFLHQNSSYYSHLQRMRYICRYVHVARN